MISEIYLSCDVEADGRIPGKNSMLSFALSAITIDKRIISSFTRNLKTLPDAVQDLDTMEFWKENPIAWQETRKQQFDPRQAMVECFNWIMKIKQETQLIPVLMAFPGGYDFMFFHWYMSYFTSHNPCGWSVLCIKSYAAAHLKIDFSNSTRRNFPSIWFQKNLPHTHIAIDDATEQGALAINMMRETRGLSKIDDLQFNNLTSIE